MTVKIESLLGYKSSRVQVQQSQV